MERAFPPERFPLRETRSVTGIAPDHPFGEDEEKPEIYGYAAGKISLKKQPVVFIRQKASFRIFIRSAGPAVIPAKGMSSRPPRFSRGGRLFSL